MAWSEILCFDGSIEAAALFIHFHDWEAFNTTTCLGDWLVDNGRPALSLPSRLSQKRWPGQ